VLPVTPAKPDAVKSSPARLVCLRPAISLSAYSFFQSCLKRGLGSTCAYPDPDSQDHHAHHNSSGAFPFSLSCSRSKRLQPPLPRSSLLPLPFMLPIYMVHPPCPSNITITTALSPVLHPQLSVLTRGNVLSQKKRQQPSPGIFLEVTSLSARVNQSGSILDFLSDSPSAMVITSIFMLGNL